MSSTSPDRPPTPTELASKLADWLVDKPTWQDAMGEWRCEMAILWKIGATRLSPREIEELYEIPQDADECYELRDKIETGLHRLLDNGTVTMRELMEQAGEDEPSSIFYAAQKFFLPGMWRD